MTHPEKPAAPTLSEKLLVFDLDGTLADTSADLTASVNAALASKSLPPLTVEQVLGFVGDGSGKLIERSVRAARSATTRDAEDIGTLLAQTAKAFAAHYADHLMDNTHPYPGADRVLRQLAKQHLLAIYSNKVLKFVTPIVVGLGWQDLFAEVIGGDWGGPRKPDPAGLVELCRKLGRSPSKSWMIGDGLTDMFAGRGANMTTVAVTCGFRSRAQLEKAAPDFFISALNELPALVGVTPDG